MRTTEILKEIKKLPDKDRLKIIEESLRLIKKGFQEKESSLYNVQRKKQLVKAAKMLVRDYSKNKELTVFTTLDSEDFHSQK